MLEVYEIPEWLSASYPSDLLNDTDEHERDWYYQQASKATKEFTFPELRIASRFASRCLRDLPKQIPRRHKLNFSPIGRVWQGK